MRDIKLSALTAIALTFCLLFAVSIPMGAEETVKDQTNYMKIIVKLDVKNIKTLTADSNRYKTVTPGHRFPLAGIRAGQTLKTAIHNTTYALLNKLENNSYRLNHVYDTLPYVALDVSPGTQAILSALPEVLEIMENKPYKLTGYQEEAKQPLENPYNPGAVMNTGTELVGASEAWDMGYTGSGWYVAVLDTGIRRTHRYFTGKTIVEACFSSDRACPNNNTQMYGTGAAAHYAASYYGHDHGTHVTGIAAGHYGSLAGVAKDSNIIAVQVFTPFPASEPSCGGTDCVLSYNADQLKGLEYVYSLRSTYSIAAVNMSLGSGYYNSYCDDKIQKPAIDNLEAVGIATVIAAGNDGYCGYISSPSCISSAVAAGASTFSDTEAYFNNWHGSLQELFAPGVSINSSTGGSDSEFQSWSGTSMAAPHVTGAWALLRQADPGAGVDGILATLRSTGFEITTLCFSGGVCPRIQIDEAIEQLGGNSTAPVIGLNRTGLYFGGIAGGPATGSQLLRVENSGDGTLQWTAASDTSWLNCSPSSGSGSGVLTVSVNTSGLSTGNYTGTITVSAPGAVNSPQTVSVKLAMINASQDNAPFGTFETPVQGSTVRGSVPVTGWVLDDVGVAYVKIYRKEGNGLVYIGDAAAVEGARPDVEQSYPGYPQNYQAGWGYMLMTYFLPNGGNGTFQLTAIAVDLSGKQTVLGSQTVTADNANAVKPFGAIDTPAVGGEASGGNYRNLGWVLTPQPNKIPEDGSTIDVYIDGVKKGHPIYNVYRSDIAALFPGYANSGGAQAYFNFDTTVYDNGIHTIAWTARDDAGNAEGIGSRYFTIENSGGAAPPTQNLHHHSRGNPVWLPGPVAVTKGYGEKDAPQRIHPDEKGIINIEIRELERVVIRLGMEPQNRYVGYSSVGNQLRPLPPGSTLDAAQGVFYWQPGPGFVGSYELVFVKTGKSSSETKKKIIITIVPELHN